MADTQVTIYDVAEKLGISAMTVSRALNGTGRVAAKTRERILAAVEELGYLPNLSAKVLNGSRTHVLGLLVGSILSQSMTSIISAIGQAVKATGMNLVIYTNSQFDATDRAGGDNVIQVLGGICDGLLVFMPGASPRMLADFERGGLPVVLLNYWHDETALPVVRGDNYHGSFAAVRHLTGLGHRRIAFIAGSAYTGQSRERQRGYLDALRQAGIVPRPEWVVDGDFAQSVGFEAATRLLALAEPPTAIFAANDEMAFGAMDAIKAHGLRIPADISVVGFDDIPSAGHVHPKLTTVRQPLVEISEAAVELLQQRIGTERQIARRVEFNSELVIRDSCGPAPDVRQRADRQD